MSGNEPHSKPVNEPQGKSFDETKVLAADEAAAKSIQTSEHQSVNKSRPDNATKTTKDPYDVSDILAELEVPDLDMLREIARHMQNFDYTKKPARRW